MILKSSRKNQQLSAVHPEEKHGMNMKQVDVLHVLSVPLLLLSVPRKCYAL